MATNTGIVFLQNNGTGTFTLNTNRDFLHQRLRDPGGRAIQWRRQPGYCRSHSHCKRQRQLHRLFPDGTGAFTAHSSPYAVSNTWNQCTHIMPGNFQSQTNGSDLALLCNNPSEAGVLVYLNSGSGGGYTYNFSSTPYSAGAFGGALPSAVVGTLNGLATIFVSSASNSFVTYQSNGCGRNLYRRIYDSGRFGASRPPGHSL